MASESVTIIWLFVANMVTIFFMIATIRNYKAAIKTYQGIIKTYESVDALNQATIAIYQKLCPTLPGGEGRLGNSSK